MSPQPDVELQVAAVKADIAAAQSARASAEHQYTIAQAQARAAAQDLKSEFGVTSAQEARDLIASLEAQVDAECSLVRDALDRAAKGAS